MTPQNHALYQRVSRLRAEALDALSEVTRDGGVLPSHEIGSLVVAMQSVGHELGIAQTLLRTAAPLPLSA